MKLMITVFDLFLWKALLITTVYEMRYIINLPRLSLPYYNYWRKYIAVKNTHLFNCFVELNDQQYHTSNCAVILNVCTSVADYIQNYSTNVHPNCEWMWMCPWMWSCFMLHWEAELGIVFRTCQCAIIFFTLHNYSLPITTDLFNFDTHHNSACA